MGDHVRQKARKPTCSAYGNAEGAGAPRLDAVPLRFCLARYMHLKARVSFLMTNVSAIEYGGAHRRSLAS